jgi:anti-sigma-K factor RskA
MTTGPRDHDAFLEQAALHVLGALRGDERAAFEAHLKGCVECTSEVADLVRVTRALDQSVPQHDPPAALRERVLAGVGGERRPETVQPARRSIMPWLAAAAVVALAAALGAYAVGLRSRVADLEARLRSVTAPLAVLTASDVARIDLAGQPAAPRAAARAFWSRSHGLVLAASNLPAPPPGRTYQLWVLTAQPAPISAGLLKPDETGGVTAVFNTPPDIPEPLAMAVTDEPDGGVPAPTGQKYLVGSAH